MSQADRGHSATMVVPYYRNPLMLRRQLDEWKRYRPETLAEVRFVVVDDGSPEDPAAGVVTDDDVADFMSLGLVLDVYRIKIDIPWNRGGARNLGSHVALTPWLLHLDVDHLLPAACADELFRHKYDRAYAYRFPRFRRGAADATRMKDDLPRTQEYGPVKPHIDSYLLTRELYWSTGGYDEDYSGCLGGGSPFLKRLGLLAPIMLLPDYAEGVHLEVHTSGSVPDASDGHLSRDTTEYMRRKKGKERRGDVVPRDPLRFQWEQAL